MERFNSGWILKDSAMAKIASPARIRRRLHALPVAIGLLILFAALMLTQQGMVI
jgi:hypothetical protein|tara:strand:+ start:1730 stop:1891 length:162 start_codon:yes stop_codon:yes gene_type:complete